MRVTLRHRTAWRTLIGFDAHDGPLPGALQDIHDLMEAQGVTAGMALMSDDDPALVVGWASVFVLAPDAVALSSESPSPHPADAVMPLVDELALGLTLDDSTPKATPLTTQKEGS